MSRTGKKRALSGVGDSSSPSKVEPPVKKSKKGVTRKCPVCEDAIPVRLLASHAEFELRRVEEIMETPPEISEEPEEESPAPRREAAKKARKSLTALSSARSPETVTEEAEKILKLIQRNRRSRFAQLKEYARACLEEDEDQKPSTSSAARSCPVCETEIPADETEEEHVDKCLARATESTSTEAEREGWETYDWGGETRIRVTSMTGFRGAGFDVRNQNHADVDDELDIDGDDAAQFGDAQFNENDIVALHDEDVEVDIDESDGEELNEGGMVRKASLRQMVAQVTSSQRTAQNLPHDDTPEHANGSSTPTIDVKGKQKAASQDFPSLMPNKAGLSTNCKICLDSYTDPLCSVGCWHVFCKDCWMRCLGSTKLCPLCKRISTATELRRIYL